MLRALHGARDVQLASHFAAAGGTEVRPHGWVGAGKGTRGPQTACPGFLLAAPS